MPVIVNATYCVDYENLNYTDRTVGTANQFESLTAPARKAKLRLRYENPSNHIIETNDQDLDNNGCATFNVVDDHPWDVWLMLQAKVGTNTVRIVQNGANPAVKHVVLTTGLDVAPGVTYNNTTWDAINNNGVRVLAAAEYALRRWDLGVTNKTIDIDLIPGDADACGNPEISCFNDTTPYSSLTGQFLATPMHISDDTIEHDRQKFTIAHELGHLLWWWANGSIQSTAYEDGLTGVGVCGPSLYHDLNTLEYPSAAVVEAIADFYAAVIWNNDSQPTCEYDTDGLDWNRDNTPETFSTHSCDGAIVDPMTLAVFTNATDYSGQYCGGSDYNAVQLDWLRLFWNLRTDNAWARTAFRDLWNNANPHTWIATEPASGASAALMPYNAMTSTLSGGTRTTWEAQAASHGVARSPATAP